MLLVSLTAGEGEADISKAKTFGYDPRYSLEEGLRETIRGFQHEA